MPGYSVQSAALLEENLEGLPGPVKIGKEAFGRLRRFPQKRTAVFTLGDEAMIVEAEVSSPADEVVKIDVSGEILPPGKSIEIRARDTLMMVVATDGSGGFAVINFFGSPPVVYGEKMSCLPVGEPVFHPLTVTRVDLKTLSGCPRLPEEGGVGKAACWQPLFFDPGFARFKNQFLSLIHI